MLLTLHFRRYSQFKFYLGAFLIMTLITQNGDLSDSRSEVVEIVQIPDYGPEGDRANY